MRYLLGYFMKMKNVILQVFHLSELCFKHPKQVVDLIIIHDVTGLLEVSVITGGHLLLHDQ